MLHLKVLLLVPEVRFQLYVEIQRSMEIFRNMSYRLQRLTISPIEQKADSTTIAKCSKELRSFGLEWLYSVAPCFSVNGRKLFGRILNILAYSHKLLFSNKVSVISEPSSFYHVVLEKSQKAKFRITIASLYLGTGALERQLVEAIGQNLRQSNGTLKVRVLLDHTRGSRGTFNSRQMLLPLLQNYKDSCQVALYHSPALRGLLHTFLPQRYNEVVGLQHMKIYLFDDSVLISGANLSNDYFTNRQDRYMLIEDCKPLADFYDEIVNRVSEFSLRLTQGDQVELNPNWTSHPYKGSQEKFVTAAREKIWSYYNSCRNTKDNDTTGDTWLFPLLQMGQLDIHQDSKVTREFFEKALPGSVIHLATGYFNLTKEYTESILHRSAALYKILMAHPLANGFLGANGPAGGIPAAYTMLAAKFLKQIQNTNQGERIRMSEFVKPRWTFHAKGLWYTLPENNLPVLTFIGSPNFGYRSVHKDLETQLVVVTTNPELQQKLAVERNRLFESSLPFTEETLKLPERRTAPVWVNVAVRLFRNLL